jgi:hypothetical protein
MSNRDIAEPACNEPPHGLPGELHRCEERACEGHDEHIMQVRRQLKPATGPMPETGTVAVALRLARGEAAAIKSLPAGGARTRARKLSEVILAKGLHLAAETRSTMPLGSTWEMHVGATVWPPPALHVSEAWRRQHTPAIQRLEVSALAYQPGGSKATRILTAHIEKRDEDGRLALHHASLQVEYDMPLPGESAGDAVKRTDRHRRREEAALRQLDEEAASEHRARKARKLQKQRAEDKAEDLDDEIQQQIINAGGIRKNLGTPDQMEEWAREQGGKVEWITVFEWGDAGDPGYMKITRLQIRFEPPHERWGAFVLSPSAWKQYEGDCGDHHV